MLASPTFGRIGFGIRRRIGPFSALQDRTVACSALFDERLGQTGQASRSCLIGEGFEIQQLSLHLLGPRLLRRFLDEDQVAQEVDITQGVLTTIPLIGGSTVMHTRSLVAGQNPIGIQSCRAPFRRFL